MRYEHEKIEDQIIATLRANQHLYDIKAQIEPNVGEITLSTFLNPTLMEGLIKRTPFVLVQYQGISDSVPDSTHTVYIDTLVFRLFIGAESLRSTRDAQRYGAYPMLRATYDALHGKAPRMLVQQQLPNASGFLSPSNELPNGIDTVGFNPVSVLMRRGGQDERLMVNTLKLVVYQKDFKIRLLA